MEKGEYITRLSLAFALAAFFLLGWYGMKADLPYSRAASEVEQVRFAVKFGSGDLNPHLFWHPPFFAYILFFLYGIFFLAGKMAGIFNSVADFQKYYFTDATVFYMIARYTVLAMGTAGIALFYFVGKSLFDKKTALAASILVALSPVYVKLVHYAAPDIPLFFMSMACLYFTVNIFKYGRMSDYVLAGIFLGLSLATKYGAVLLAPPVFAAHLLSTQGRGLKAKIINKKLMVLFMCALLGMFLGNPFAFLDHKSFLASFLSVNKKIGEISYNFASWKADKPGWAYILTDTMPFGLGYLPALFIVLGILYSLYRRKKEDYLLLSLILVSYILIGRWNVIKPRYFIFVFPFGFLLGARFVMEKLRGARFPATPVRIFAVCAVSILLVVEPLSIIAEFEKRVSRKPVYLQAKEWIESNVPSNTAIANFTGISTVPLVPNEASIERSLAEIKAKKMGEGIMLKSLEKHLKYIPLVYDVYELPYPWRADYEDKDFDFKGQVNNGVKYFIFTQEVEEYYADPKKYSAQVRYIEGVRKNCFMVKEFRQARPMLEPGYISKEEYVQIYRYGPGPNG